ncbi:SigE family RNA polymerase sigma factor [Nocardioides sp.]|uniref:SigE family RNA polymerase sigma factor n=1 Tax=Nocardioides sp. TaxID=35761 RepID=UPI001A278B86|nr:SigE family RNA polymerase sigma factor [Nocardioides sp.]MBJ7359097.1 SigE family RNA polymerase sigma factor [Nocardioides sp.]
MESESEASFTRWAGDRQLALLRTAVLLTGDHHRAEDLVQDALAKVAARWERLRDEAPESYARKVIVRTNISWWRKQRREVVTEPGDRPVDGGEPSVDRRILLDQALARLTARQRAAVVLRYYDDLPERETAEALGVSVGTVKSTTHHALRQMRESSPELAELLGAVEEVR